MQITSEDVFTVVRNQGPVVPNRIKQALQQQDSTLVNVYLSELLRDKKIRKTKVKLGTSSFYYLPDHRSRLESVMKHLNEKERRVAERLRTEKVLQASVVDPLTRVALQEIIDYAVPIQVRVGDGTEIFYRYFLTSTDEAQQRIRSVFQPTISAPKKEVVEQPVEAPKKEVNEKQEVVKEPVQQKLKPSTAVSAFTERIQKQLEEKGVRVIEISETRKNKEAQGVLRLKTPLGDVMFFARIKDKKTSNDGDLAEAILAAKAHMLPALYITTGTVTKKARTNPHLQEITVVELGNSN